MEALITWLSDIPKEWVGASTYTAFLALLELRTPEKRETCRAWVIKRVTGLWTEAKATLRPAFLPFTVSLTVAILLEETQFAGYSQAAFAVVLLSYPCYFAGRHAVRRFR